MGNVIDVEVLNENEEVNSNIPKIFFYSPINEKILEKEAIVEEKEGSFDIIFPKFPSEEENILEYNYVEIIIKQEDNIIKTLKTSRNILNTDNISNIPLLNTTNLNNIQIEVKYLKLENSEEYNTYNFYKCIPIEVEIEGEISSEVIILELDYIISNQEKNFFYNGYVEDLENSLERFEGKIINFLDEPKEELIKNIKLCKLTPLSKQRFSISYSKIKLINIQGNVLYSNRASYAPILNTTNLAFPTAGWNIAKKASYYAYYLTENNSIKNATSFPLFEIPSTNSFPIRQTYSTPTDSNGNSFVYAIFSLFLFDNDAIATYNKMLGSVKASDIPNIQAQVDNAIQQIDTKVTSANTSIDTKVTSSNELIEGKVSSANQEIENKVDTELERFLQLLKDNNVSTDNLRRGDGVVAKFLTETNEEFSSPTTRSNTKGMITFTEDKISLGLGDSRKIVYEKINQNSIKFGCVDTPPITTDNLIYPTIDGYKEHLSFKSREEILAFTNEYFRDNYKKRINNNFLTDDRTQFNRVNIGNADNPSEDVNIRMSYREFTLFIKAITLNTTFVWIDSLNSKRNTITLYHDKDITLTTEVIIPFGVDITIRNLNLIFERDIKGADYPIRSHSKIFFINVFFTIKILNNLKDITYYTLARGYTPASIIFENCKLELIDDAKQKIVRLCWIAITSNNPYTIVFNSYITTAVSNCNPNLKMYLVDCNSRSAGADIYITTPPTQITIPTSRYKFTTIAAYKTITFNSMGKDNVIFRTGQSSFPTTAITQE